MEGEVKDASVVLTGTVVGFGPVRAEAPLEP